MTAVNIFEQASRNKLRFNSVKGLLNVEQLWDLPLQSKTSLDLDTIAKATNEERKTLVSDSFIPSANARPNPRKAELELMMEILIYIIQVRVDENVAKGLKADRDARRAKLMDALEHKQNADLLNMTAEQIKEELAKL